MQCNKALFDHLVGAGDCSGVSRASIIVASIRKRSVWSID
jgi:hypothetical protein